MTYHKKQKTKLKQKCEFKITSKMLKAGARALADMDDDAFSCVSDETLELIANAVFSVMVRASER
jgi:hypothetical protein